MDNIEFRKPNINDGENLNSFLDEFTSANEKIIPASAGLKGLPFNSWLKKKNNLTRGVNLPKDKVPASIYFLIKKDNSKILGAIDIRHELNDHLLQQGGHIGYGVAPSERRKGYASYMLGLSLDICKKELGLKKVLITCDKTNIGSNKTIIKYGGTLEDEFVEDSGNIIFRYWINLKE